ncbi:hypothetical protein ScPMuIL_013004 [Solemya velum]
MRVGKNEIQKTSSQAVSCLVKIQRRWGRITTGSGTAPTLTDPRKPIELKTGKLNSQLSGLEAIIIHRGVGILLKLLMSEPVDFNLCVVIPASGTGERMCLPSPKQFCTVLDKPLITYTLHTFNSIPCVEQIIVTVSSQFIPLMRELIAENGFSRVTVVEGATTRHRSIYNGIKAIAKVCAQPDVVLIQDGVRVFADADFVKDIAVAAHKHGAAGVVRPLVSTVIAADAENFLEESLDRTKYRASEMPQAFRYEVIKSAYEKITDYDFDYGTECLHLALKYTGTMAYLLEGPNNLWKVTHKKDLYAVTGMLKEHFLTVLLDGEVHHSLEETVTKSIQKKGMRVLPHSGPKTQLHSVTGLVCFHSDPSIQNIQCKTLELISSIRTVRNSTSVPISSIAVVHIFNSKTNISRPYGEFVNTVQASAKMNKDVYTFCILYEPNGDYEDRLAEMTASLLWERNPVFSGQVFYIND